MGKPLSKEVASKIMLDALLEPLEEYPADSKAHWKCRCMQCGAEVKTSLASVRVNGGGCRACGLRKSAKSRIANSQEAENLMRAAGAVPISPYPGSGKPWLCKCSKCGKRLNPDMEM
jgi:DNA-directed RNA polymerase subunit RPC12/RpoP